MLEQYFQQLQTFSFRVKEGLQNKSDDIRDNVKHLIPFQAKA